MTEFEYDIPGYIIAVGLIYLLPLTSMSVVNCNLPWSLVYKKCKNRGKNNDSRKDLTTI